MFNLLQSSDIYADTSIEHGALHRSPNHRGVECAAPRVSGIDDRLLLTEAREVLSTNIDGEMTEPAGDLCRYLFVGWE